MRTANPALNDKAFRIPAVGITTDEVMTLQGTVNKTFLAITLTMASAYIMWLNPEYKWIALPAIVAALIASIVVIFKKNTAPFLTPVYAVCEGAALGTISLYAEMKYPGVVFQAISLTFGTLFCLLTAYRSGLIKPSENFKLGIAAATGAIFVVYLLNFILSLFGMPMSFMHGSGTLSIGISGFVVVIAALNLVLDFDFIENAAARGNMPKYMEWYGAFGLLVTLVWLYIEILHLLMKLRSRD